VKKFRPAAVKVQKNEAGAYLLDKCPIKCKDEGIKTGVKVGISMVDVNRRSANQARESDIVIICKFSKSPKRSDNWVENFIGEGCETLLIVIIAGCLYELPGSGMYGSLGTSDSSFFTSGADGSGAAAAAAQESVEGYVDAEGGLHKTREEAEAEGKGKSKSCVRRRSGGSNIKSWTWHVVFELTPLTEGEKHFATGSVNWEVNYKHAPRGIICRSAAKKLGIIHTQELSSNHILKVSVDLGSKEKAAEALKTPSTIKWAKARVDGVKGYKGMRDVE